MFEPKLFMALCLRRWRGQRSLRVQIKTFPALVGVRV